MDKLQNFIIKFDEVPESKTWLSCTIVDDEEHLIGKINGIGGFRLKISWLKADGSLLVSAHKRAIELRDIYDIKDSAGKLLGIVKSKGLLHPQKILKNPAGTTILTYKKIGNSSPSFEFRDEEGKVIAQFEIKEEKLKEKSWKERHLTGNVRTSCIFSIKDLTFDKLLLLGFFISIFGNHFFQLQAQSIN